MQNTDFLAKLLFVVLSLSKIENVSTAANGSRCYKAIDLGYTWKGAQGAGTIRYYYNIYTQKCVAQTYVGFRVQIDDTMNEFLSLSDCQASCELSKDTQEVKITEIESKNDFESTIDQEKKSALDILPAKDGEQPALDSKASTDDGDGKLLLTVRMVDEKHVPALADRESAEHRQFRRDFESMMSMTLRSFDTDEELKAQGWTGEYHSEAHARCQMPWKLEMLQISSGSTTSQLALTPPGGNADTSSVTNNLKGLTLQPNGRRKKRSPISQGMNRTKRQTVEQGTCIDTVTTASGRETEQRIEQLKKTASAANINVDFSSFKEFCTLLDSKFDELCVDPRNIGNCDRHFCTAFAHRCMSTPLENLPWSRTECECEDEDDFCCFWASEGLCESSESFVKQTCKRSCGTCDCQDNESTCATNVSPSCQIGAPVPSNVEVELARNNIDVEDCEDLDANCCKWQALGECDSRPFWMRVNCPKACGTCGCSYDRALAGVLCQPSASACVTD